MDDYMTGDIGADLQLVIVPFDTAQRGQRMGAGPEHLLRSGAVERLIARGHRVRVETVTPADAAFPAEIRTAFDLQRAVAESVRRAVDARSFPIVVAGNCNVAALGVLAGIQSRDTGVVWFDAHGDFNTPETTAGGFLDGMALSMVTGHCWREMVAQLPDFEPVPEANVLLFGARDLDPLEASLLAESAVTLTRVECVHSESEKALNALRRRVRDVYVHIDLDVLDPAAHGRVNKFAAAGGLTVGAVVALLDRIAGRFGVRGAALTAYDPAFDADGRVRDAALTLLEAVADTARAASAGLTRIGPRARER